MGDLLDQSLDDELTFSNIYCDHGGYIAPHFVEYGMHSLEYERNNEIDRENEYTREPCRNNKDLRWGMETRELCKLVKSAYEKIVHLKNNTHPVPANKVEKELLNLYAETLEWVDPDGIENHFEWHAHYILFPMCLQIKDRKQLSVKGPSS